MVLNCNLCHLIMALKLKKINVIKIFKMLVISLLWFQLFKCN